MGEKKELVNLNDIKIEMSDLEKVEMEYERFLESIENVKGDIEVLLSEENRYLYEANEKLRNEIEERRTIELRLNDQLLFLGALMDAIPNPIAYYSKEGAYLGSNRAFSGFAGIDPEESVGKERGGILNIKKRAEAASRILCDGKCVAEECEITDVGGVKHEMMIYSSGYETSRENIGGRVEVLIDITEPKEADRMQRVQEQLLIQQSKMAAMGEMISHIADRWRQPLDALSGVIEGVMDAHRSGRLDKPYIGSAIEQGTEITQEMARTIDEFGSFFKPDRKKSRFTVKEVLGVTLDLLHATLERYGIVVSVSGDGSVGLVGYPNEYSQVLLNILHNATDILVERRVKNPEIMIKYGKRNNRAYITVADNGGGVEKGMEAKIFQLYFSTKKERSGTGIGLYMAKTIIEQHLGGTVTVRNGARGAEFTVEVSAKG